MLEHWNGIQHIVHSHFGLSSHFCDISFIVALFYGKAHHQMNSLVMSRSGAPTCSCAGVRRFLSFGCLSSGVRRHASSASSTSLEEASAKVEELRKRCVDLQRQLEARNAVLRELLRHIPDAASLLAPQAEVLEGSMNVRVVRSDEELEAAIKHKVRSIVLLDGHRYCLVPQPFTIKNSSISLFGKATIECSLRCVDAVLEVTDTTLVSPCPSLPVIDATSGSRVYLSHCTVAHGRDGLYLSNSSTARCQSSTFTSNVRGLFEGIGCGADCEGCSFRDNLFHAVLLHRPTHQRAFAFSASPLLNTFCGVSRGDVVMQYNPMTDVYTDVIKEGTVRVLTAEDSTANLCDPTW